MAAPRRRGTGSLFKRPGTNLWTMAYYMDGRKVRERTGTADKTEAQRMLTRRLYEVGTGELVHRLKPVRVVQLYQNLVEHYRANGKTRAIRDIGDPAHTDHPQGHWIHLGPEFGRMEARRVTTAEVDAYIARRRKDGAAKATVNRETGTLRRSFNLGRRSGLLQSVPHFTHLDETDNVRRGFVEDDGYRALISQARDLWFRAFLELAFTYGFRLGELIQMRCGQVDFRHGTIRLEPGTTKNKEGRQVVMTRQVRTLLEECTANQEPSAYLFRRKNGTCVRDVQWAWRRATVAVGLGTLTCPRCEAQNLVPSHNCSACKRRVRLRYLGLKVHDLRRSAARLARLRGVPETVCMEMLGHKTRAMFARYAINATADQRQAADLIERGREETANQPRTGLVTGLVGGKTAVQAPRVVTTKVQ